MNHKKYKTKTSMVYSNLRDDIMHRLFRPGQKLLISRIAEEYGTSEIPVREALQTLAQEGLLTLKPNAGFFVSKISLKDVRNIFSVRIKLEDMAVFEATNKITDEKIAELEKMIDESEQYVGKMEFPEYWKFNRTWHFALYEQSDNEVLTRMLSGLFDYSSRYPGYYTKANEIKSSIKNHRAILDAVKQRNADYAKALIHVHTIESALHYETRLKDELGSDLGE